MNRSARVPMMRQPKPNQIHVAGLPPGVTVDFIRSLFSECGTVINVSLKSKPMGSYCFVEFAQEEDAEKATRDFNYTKLNGQSITITQTKKEVMERISSGEGNLYVKGIDESIEAPQLHELFSNFGEVISVKIPTINGRSRGFAYVQFLNPDDAEKAARDLNESMINGKTITIERFIKRERKPDVAADNSTMDPTFTNVFIKNLPDSVGSLLDLIRLFQEYGTVLSARFIPEKRSGFANMARHEDAVAAVLGLNGRTIYERTLSCCRSLSVEERASFLTGKPTN